ncbi:MAG TPA: hypothetical protein VLA61_12580 [Ideonella sp.]|uniref:hypothetical protein n=1 Tax=Ideonella sp. TaxID=1929293 RepID=UPI002C422B10|nr:hypothetical protein [Ideonella sp.]HSI49100.1 hypothetical protein [Ideonella sp.]
MKITHPLRLAALAALVAQAMVLAACGGSDDATPVAPVPSTLDVGGGIPEDVVVNGSVAYVSNLNDGSVLKLDLANGGASSTFIAPATDALSSAWGLRVVPAQNWLLSLKNVPYDFNPTHAQAGRLSAFDLTSGGKVRSWALPAQTVGNSVDVDKDGNLYVGDIGPQTRIVKINPANDSVTVWATDPRWVLNGFGIGGMVYDGTGIYAAHNNKLWFIGINADGSAATPAQVSIEGDPVIFADGMTWVDGGIYYAENDLMVPGAHGSVFRIAFTDKTTARRTVVQENLFDPSGVTTASVGGRNYLLVNESRLGYAFGTETGQATPPYHLQVFAR